MANATDLKSVDLRLVGSNPTTRTQPTSMNHIDNKMKKQSISHKFLSQRYILDLNHPRLILIDYNAISASIKQLNRRWIKYERRNFDRSKKKY